MLMNTALRGLLPAGLALLSLVGSAEAADLGPYPSQPSWRAPQSYGPAPFTWTGIYAGFQGGYGWGGTDATSTTLTSGFNEAFSYNTSGGIGGGHLGFNWQNNALVLGLETDLEASGISGEGNGSAGGRHITNIDWLGSLRGRLGYATGNTLFYLTGGVAYGGVSVDRSAGAAFAPFIGSSDWRTGWTAGGGIEHAFTPRITARLEYRYTDLGSNTFWSLPANITDSSDVSFSAVRAGLSFKF